MLFVLFVVLWRARPAFDRRAAFFETRFSAPWMPRLWAPLALRSGLASLPSSTLPIRGNSGGSSSCRARRPDSCARPSVPRSYRRCSGSRAWLVRAARGARPK